MTDDEKEKEMDFIKIDGISTYEDISNFYLAKGWGCKSCGWLQSREWWQCSGDTYCEICKVNILVPLGDVVLHQYPRTGLAGMSFEYEPNSFGFEYAEHMRKDFERVYGDQPWSWNHS
jgi:hypothetical protein